MRCLLLALALLLVTSWVQADALVYTSQLPQGGAKGLIIDRPVDEIYACALVWEQSENPIWSMGLDISQNYPGVPDLVLANNSANKNDCLRMRQDDARMALGPQVGHPIVPFQLSLEPNQSNGGLCVGTSNYQWAAYFYNRGPNNNEAAISFNNLWLVGSDLYHNGATDFTFYSFQAQTPVVTLGEAGGVGFFGAAPTAKPVVSGSWSDGSAAKSVLAALVKLGLAQDTTTP
jgi:hypothetical protein